MRIPAIMTRLLLLLFIFSAPATAGFGETLAFKVGKVVTFDNEERVINNATVIVENGKITAVGKSKEI